MEQEKYKAVIFDFFGVISSEVAPVWFKEYLPREDMAELRKTYLEPSDIGEMSAEELFDQLSKLVPLSPQEIRRQWLALTVVRHDMIDLIKKLSGRYKLAILSDTQSSLFREIIAINKLEGLFDNIFVSSEIRMTKADIKIYQLALKELGVRAEESIFTDDKAANVERARSLGIKGFVFTDRPTLENDIKKEGLWLTP